MKEEINVSSWWIFAYDNESVGNFCFFLWELGENCFIVY